jgi:hypothetical protein
VPRTTRHRVVAAAAGVVALVALVLVVTAFTGFPGPGPLRRYTASQLNALVDAVHADAGALRTPDDCWQTLEPEPSGRLRPVAAVDWVRSRVVVGMRSDNIGRVTERTRTAIEERVQAIVDADPELSMDMVVFEPSPEGWSPEMSCALVLRGWSGS